jgi:Na+/glutamate symporter
MEQAGTVIGIVSGVFGGIILLLIYIWNTAQKANEERHRANEKANEERHKANEERHKANEMLIEKLSDVTVQQGKLLTKLDTMIEIHDKQLDKVK